MDTKIAQWGNSSAVRLPAEVLARAGLKPGTPVRLTASRRGVLIEPVTPRYTLDALLAAYRPEHAHVEPDWGEDIGGERVPE